MHWLNVMLSLPKRVGAISKAGRHETIRAARFLALIIVIGVLVYYFGVRASTALIFAEFGGGGGGGGDDTPFIISILNFIWGAIVALVQFLNQVLNAIFDQLVNIAKAVASGIVKLGQFFVRVWSLLRRFWTDVLKPLLVKVAKLIDQFRKWLEHIFKPLIDFVTKIRTWLQRIYKDVLRPILDIIDAFRLFLRGLGALGVDWAKELDQQLGRLEQKLTAPLLLAIKTVNEILGVLDRIMTLDGIFTKLIWLQSLAGYRKPTFNFLWNSQSTPLSSTDLSGVKTKHKAPSKDETAADLRELLETKSGNMDTRASELADQMRIWLRD